MTPINCITDITRSLPKQATTAAYATVPLDHIRILAVCPGEFEHLLSAHPPTAGNQYHGLLKRMADNLPLSPSEKAYLPWLNSLRAAARSLGACELAVEAKLAGKGVVPAGTCDILAHGQNSLGVVEAKVIVAGTLETPRGRDLAQLGSYARLVAGHRSFIEAIWSG